MSALDSDGQQSQPKKLRFITNQGAPHPKRRRVTAACLTCRKRKIACSGEQPLCQTCIQNKLDCAGFSKNQSNGGEETPPRMRPPVKRESRDDVRHISNDAATAQQTFGGNNLSPGLRGFEPVSTGTLFSRPRNRMPYFRWLGPTAIMPGFKQMVVKVKRQETGGPSSTDEGPVSPALSNTMASTVQRAGSGYSITPKPVESDVRTPLTLPFYDGSSMPPSELITHLCTTFFTHLGCNFPFLQKTRFLKDLEEKQVDTILVDAVCAMAARFSKHQLLLEQFSDSSKVSPAEYGQTFAHRAKAALMDTFAVPNVAAVQAALLLAYNEFGESRDSGLWMYLGISIRLAQDLGLQKLEGLRYEGRDGPTPRMVKKSQDNHRSPTLDIYHNHVARDDAETSQESQEQRAVERERVDTFWSVFFLDRVVSSGTGRRSTLRDNEIELSFPSLDSGYGTDSQWPSPFPALIRIVHLYGRVADLLNGIKEPADITAETTKRLASMEAQVTSFYQGLSPRLHFEAMNFHHYVKASEGTNFVLLHFWFHTLIILLHQPTLLKTFEGRMLQLFPNSQQLSMSSAKTIADILSYSQLIDARAGLGNPFTTQPIYIAACAFLKETAEQTATSAHQSQAQSRAGSRACSPSRSSMAQEDGLTDSTNAARTQIESKLSVVPGGKVTPTATTEKSLAKHTLLATAASQHYQLCYRALESIETYWAGAKYILTVLEQKFKGVGDPLLYTAEEGESSLEQPKPEPAFTSPGWRRKMSSTPSYLTSQTTLKQVPSPFLHPGTPSHVPGSPAAEHSQAIGWTLTGTLNSPSTNLAWHYPNVHSAQIAGSSMAPGLQNAGHSSAVSRHASLGTKQPLSNGQDTQSRTASSGSLPNPIPLQRPAMQTYQSNASFDLSTPNTSQAAYQPTMNNMNMLSYGQNHSQSIDYLDIFGPPSDQYSTLTSDNSAPFGDMLIESQDVDMSMLGLDMLPWLDPPPGDMMPLFDTTTQSEMHDQSDHAPQM